MLLKTLTKVQRFSFILLKFLALDLSILCEIEVEPQSWRSPVDEQVLLNELIELLHEIERMSKLKSSC